MKTSAEGIRQKVSDDPTATGLWQFSLFWLLSAVAQCALFAGVVRWIMTSETDQSVVLGFLSYLPAWLVTPLFFAGCAAAIVLRPLAIFGLIGVWLKDPGNWRAGCLYLACAAVAYWQLEHGAGWSEGGINRSLDALVAMNAIVIAEAKTRREFYARRTIICLSVTATICFACLAILSGFSCC